MEEVGKSSQVPTGTRRLLNPWHLTYWRFAMPVVTIIHRSILNLDDALLPEDRSSLSS
jgi:hypothetical protein